MIVMATMKSVMVEEIGKPVVIRIRPVPEPDEGEVQVKVSVVGLNWYEHRVRDWGLHVQNRLPVVLGNDIAGVVTKLGQGVQDLEIGDVIFGQTNYLKLSSDQCGLQKYAVLDAYTVAKIPHGFTEDDGATLVCNIIAPFWAIFGVDGLGLPFPFPGEPVTVDYPKQTIAILGAGSNCGKYAVQCSNLAGFGCIIAVAAKLNEAELLSYGATHVIDRHAPDVWEQVRAVTGDDLIYAFEAWSLDHTLGVSLLSDSKRGTLACIVPGEVPVRADEIGPKHAGYEDKFLSGQSHNQPELGARFWKFLPGWMTEGKVKPSAYDALIDWDWDVGKINKVLDAYRDGHPPKKRVNVHIKAGMP